MDDQTDYSEIVAKIATMKDTTLIPWEPTVELMKRMSNKINQLKAELEQAYRDQDK